MFSAPYSSSNSRFAEALVKRMPTDDYRVFFTNSGAESVETALKYVRCATGRERVLYADHAFHGLTTGALSLNGGTIRDTATNGASLTLPLVMPYPIDEDYGSAVRRALEVFAPR